MEKHKSAPKARTQKQFKRRRPVADTSQWRGRGVRGVVDGRGERESTPGPAAAATHAHMDWLTDWLTGCTHIVRGGAIIINFPAKLNFNAFAAAEMKTKIASIGKIAKKSSGCCALQSISVCVFA